MPGATSGIHGPGCRIAPRTPKPAFVHECGHAGIMCRECRHDAGEELLDTLRAGRDAAAPFDLPEAT
ncbi:MAG: hypothetical protein IAF01_03370 [Xanthomonadaceae bacterium]|nr:hypothetical protein [Xanthomonadaceae bacterium]MCA0197365.1 hypothetical protein [Pseudomonadota bacterium]HRF84864.1 hypothetical protein [Pseudoxanthomonas sp.]